MCQRASLPDVELEKLSEGSLPEAHATLGHGNIATTSGYLHARPDSLSGLLLDRGVFLR
jgi:hypothetical protein